MSGYIQRHIAGLRRNALFYKKNESTFGFG